MKKKWKKKWQEKDKCMHCKLAFGKTDVRVFVEDKFTGKRGDIHENCHKHFKERFKIVKLNISFAKLKKVNKEFAKTIERIEGQ